MGGVFFEIRRNKADPHPSRPIFGRRTKQLLTLGYTEHSFPHVGRVAVRAKYILETLGYSAHDIELVQIAAYLHDIGNLINRVDHSQSGAVMAFQILNGLGMDAADIATIVHRHWQPR